MPQHILGAVDSNVATSPSSTLDNVVETIFNVGDKALDLFEKFTGIFGESVPDSESVPQKPGDDPDGPSPDRTTGATAQFLTETLGSTEFIGMVLVAIAIFALLAWRK